MSFNSYRFTWECMKSFSHLILHCSKKPLEKQQPTTLQPKNLCLDMGGTSIKTAHLNMLASIIVTTCCSQQQLEYQTLALKIGHPTLAEWQKFTKTVGKMRQLCLLWKWSEQHSNTWQQRALIFKVVTFLMTWTETVLIKFSTTTTTRIWIMI